MSMPEPKWEPASTGRRQFCAVLAGALVTPGLAWSAKNEENAESVALYASVGPELALYPVADGDIGPRPDSVLRMPANIQYVWPHPSRKLLYVAYSNRAGSSPGDVHGVSVMRVDGPSGQLQPAGSILKLNNRPINITVDHTGRYLFVAYNDPSELDVYAIKTDGSLGSRVDRKSGREAGIYAHQVRIDRANRSVFLMTRGNDGTRTAREDPGAIKVFDFRHGRLLNEQSDAPHNGFGFGFGPRHLDVHPTKPWVYVSMERENELQVFGLRDGKLSPAPLFTKTTLAEPANVHPAQVVGPIHVSRDGRFVYLANRSDGTVEFEGKKVYVGGENSIAVFRIDEQTGEPTLIQNAPTEGFHARTFSLHPNGHMLVAASVSPMLVRDGDRLSKVPAALSVFQVEENGTLKLVRKQDVDTTGGPLFWCGMMALGAGWKDNTA